MLCLFAVSYDTTPFFPHVNCSIFRSFILVCLSGPVSVIRTCDPKIAGKMRITFVVAIFLGAASSQLIIPPRPLGYIYNNGSFTAPIHMDVHMGPLCPDSAAAFPNVKQVADYYTRAMLKLTLHMFPLPYHRQSYFTATVSMHSLSSL